MSLTVNTKYAEREDTSELVSPTFSTNDSSCLMFYYVFPTSVSGTIDVYQRQLDNNLVVILNKISGSVGPSWRFFSVDVPASKKFKVLIIWNNKWMYWICLYMYVITNFSSFIFGLTSFEHISTVTASVILHDSTLWCLTWMPHHPVTLFWHRKYKLVNYTLYIKH